MAGDLRHLKMTRRDFVGFGCALLPGTMTALRAVAQRPASSTLIVVIDEIPDDIEPLVVEGVFSEFLKRRIPVSWVVDIGRLTAPATSARAQHGAKIGAVLARETGLVEIVLLLDESDDGRRYFQMRSAEQLRAAATAFLSDTAEAPGGLPIVSLMDRREADLLDLSAYRSAGFRVLIRPGASGPMTTKFLGRGQMQLLGRNTVHLTAPQAEIRAQLDESLDGGQDRMLVLSLSDMTTGGASGLRDRISGIAARIDVARKAGSVVAIRPMDYLLMSGPHQSADRALVLPYGETAQEQTALAAFVQELRAAGLPFTATGREAPEWLKNTDDFCPGWPAGQSGPPHDQVGARACLLSSATGLTSAPDRVPGLMIVPGDGGAWNGVRADGRMHLVFHQWARVGPADEAPFEDLVLMIRPGDVLLPTQRDAILHELVSAVREGRIRLHTVSGLADLVLAPEPALTRLWSTRQRMVTDPPRTDALSAGGRDMLLDDARLAWTFIDRFTDPKTGLCAGTVQEGPDRRVNLEASLWDIASQLQGIIAARSMDIIAMDEARDRVQLMLRNIPLIELGGLILPPAMFLTDRTAKVVVRGFDICDAGRFLIALRSAVAAGLASEAEAVATRSAWDLAAMVQGSNAFNISGGRRVDVTISHCTPYIARTFAELGLHMRSPYSQIGEPSDAGDHMRLLYSAARIGSFGTEPLLLEAIEQGASPEVEFLSAVLFDAQVSWYEATGQMKCVSEAPLNIEPWFIYQGLRADRLGDAAWTIESPNGSPRFETAEFRQRAEVLSSKSAYLWAAVHPHSYCDMLVRVMRDKGRIENLGFSVGVFTESLEAMKNYSDLNTNGIILSAIAAMLKPSWPNL